MPKTFTLEDMIDDVEASIIDTPKEVRPSLKKLKAGLFKYLDAEERLEQARARKDAIEIEATQNELVRAGQDISKALVEFVSEVDDWLSKIEERDDLFAAAARYKADPLSIGEKTQGELLKVTGYANVLQDIIIQMLHTPRLIDLNNAVEVLLEGLISRLEKLDDLRVVAGYVYELPDASDPHYKVILRPSKKAVYVYPLKPLNDLVPLNIEYIRKDLDDGFRGEILLLKPDPKHTPGTLNLREVTSAHLYKPFKVRARVIQSEFPTTRLYYVRVDPEDDEFRRFLLHQEAYDEHGKRIRAVPDLRNVRIDVQELILEDVENSDFIMPAYVDHDLVGKLEVGREYVFIVIPIETDPQKREGGIKLYITAYEDASATNPTEEDLKKFEEFKRLSPAEKLKVLTEDFAWFIFPEREGFTLKDQVRTMKLAMLLSAVRASSALKNTREMIHTLIIGELATGKSEVARELVKITTKSRFIQVKTSLAGLIGTTTRLDGKQVVRPGVLAQVDGGTVVIDELDKFNEKKKEELAALNNAMEQGSVTITPDGTSREYPARTSIIALANPRGGLFNERDVVEELERLGLDYTMLSRFDIKIAIYNKSIKNRKEALRKGALRKKMDVAGYVKTKSRRGNTASCSRGSYCPNTSVTSKRRHLSYPPTLRNIS